MKVLPGFEVLPHFLPLLVLILEIRTTNGQFFGMVPAVNSTTVTANALKIPPTTSSVSITTAASSGHLVTQGYVIPGNRTFIGNHWEAAALCYNVYNKSGLPEINSVETMQVFLQTVKPNASEHFYLASSRINDVLLGSNDPLTFKDTKGVSIPSSLLKLNSSISSRLSLVASQSTQLSDAATDGHCNKGNVCGLVCQQLVSTSCSTPPLRMTESQAGIQIVTDPPNMAEYPFGTNVTYLCPLGKRFAETNSRQLTATCFGPVGWKRAVMSELKCVADYFASVYPWTGTHWDAAAYCYSQNQSGLAALSNATAIRSFMNISSTANYYWFIFAGVSRAQDSQMTGNVNKTFRDAYGLTVDQSIWSRGEPDNYGVEEELAAFLSPRTRLIGDITPRCNVTDPTWICGAACQYSAPSNCEAPPLSDEDIKSGLTVTIGSDPANKAEKYPFGTVATYRCPPSQVFNSTIQGTLTAACFGAAGWKRPLKLTCIDSKKLELGIFIPDFDFLGTHWEAARLCFSNGGAGLLEVENKTILDKVNAILPQSSNTNEVYYLATSRQQDMQNGIDNPNVFKATFGAVIPNLTTLWRPGKPDNYLKMEYSLALRSGLMDDVLTECQPGVPNYNSVCRTVCQKSTPTTCDKPPLTAPDNASGIIVEVTSISNTSGLYSFGTNATYICPLGKVFNGTFSRYLVATCHGSVGWYRPIKLTCTDPDQHCVHTVLSLEVVLETIGTRQFHVDGMDPRTLTVMNAFDAEAYCSSVGSTLPLLMNVSDVQLLGSMLQKQGASAGFVANHIRTLLDTDKDGTFANNRSAAWDLVVPDRVMWLPDSLQKIVELNKNNSAHLPRFTVLRLNTTLAHWGLSHHVITANRTVSAVLCEKEKSECTAEAMPYFPPAAMAWVPEPTPESGTRKYGELQFLSCKGLEFDQPKTAIECFGRLGFGFIRTNFPACTPLNPYVLGSQKENFTGSVLNAHEVCYKEHQLSLPDVKSPEDIRHLVGVVATQLGNLNQSSSFVVPLSNHILRPSTITDQNSYLQLWAPAVPSNTSSPLWLEGEPRLVQADKVCSYLKQGTNGTWGLAAIACTDSVSGNLTKAVVVCGLSNETDCQEGPPLSTEVLEMSNGSDPANSSFGFGTVAMYTECPCGKVRPGTQFRSSHKTSCTGMLGWYPPVVGECIDGVETCLGTPALEIANSNLTCQTDGNSSLWISTCTSPYTWQSGANFQPINCTVESNNDSFNGTWVPISDVCVLMVETQMTSTVTTVNDGEVANSSTTSPMYQVTSIISNASVSSRASSATTAEVQSQTQTAALASTTTLEPTDWSSTSGYEKVSTTASGTLPERSTTVSWPLMDGTSPTIAINYAATTPSTSSVSSTTTIITTSSTTATKTELTVP